MIVKAFDEYLFVITKVSGGKVTLKAEGEGGCKLKMTWDYGPGPMCVLDKVGEEHRVLMEPVDLDAR